MAKTTKKAPPKAAPTKAATSQASVSHWLDAIKVLAALIQEVLALLRGMQAEQQTIMRAVTAPTPAPAAKVQDGAVLAAVAQALAEVGVPPGQCEAITTSLRTKLAAR